MSRPFLMLAASAALALGTLGLVEGGLALLLRNPGAIPESALDVFREYYLFRDRRIVQYDPACAAYDPRLTYRLRPGTCRFRNREFDVTLEVNAQGFRDDEASLSAPEIIVLGDSHAMGWGVAQDESFPQGLEARLGRRVLNVATSSWGTARELRALEGVDLSRLEWLVVQYSRNDLLENLEQAKAGGVLGVSDPQTYAAAAEAMRRDIAYWPGKHLAVVMGLALAGPERWESRFIDHALSRHGMRREVEVFLAALEAAPLPWSRLRLAVLEVNGRARNRPRFTRVLRARLEAGEGPLPADQVVLLETSRLLSPDHHFRLDDHMRAAGHARLAEALARQLGASADPSRAARL